MSSSFSRPFGCMRKRCPADEDGDEGLRSALRYADDRYDPVYPDFYILQAAADLIRDEDPALSRELDEFRSRLIDALDAGGDADE